MLTIFAIPKRFEGHFGLIQRNAIQSWARLQPRPELILFGSDEGTAEMAAEVGARHVPQVAVSPAGAPMFDDVIAQGQAHATQATVCFLNADIVLTPEWMTAVQTVVRWGRPFLMVGRRWNLDVLAPLPFESPTWSQELLRRATSEGKLATNMYIDYFVFPRGGIPPLPPFVIGRPGYDNWLLWNTRKRGIALIDATRAAPVIHQNHDYSHIKAVGRDVGGHQTYLRGADTLRNAELAGGWTRSFTSDHATHILEDGQVKLALRRQYADARVETLRRHVVDLTRPLRRKVGLDEEAYARLRAKLIGR